MYQPKQEKSLQNAVKDFIRFHGGYCQNILSGVFCLNAGTKYQRWVHAAEKGTPDIFAIIKSKAVTIEVKKDEKTAIRAITSKEKHAVEQRQRRDEIRRAGGVCLVVGSLNQLQTDLRELALI